jgi:hypothetical protein
LTHIRFALIEFDLTIFGIVPQQINAFYVTADQRKIQYIDSPTSKPLFLSFMLRMGKDHRSAGLRWSLPLSGVGLGGHGSLLGFFNSCLIFPITSLFPADVAADAFLEVSTMTVG